MQPEQGQRDGQETDGGMAPAGAGNGVAGAAARSARGPVPERGKAAKGEPRKPGLVSAGVVRRLIQTLSLLVFLSLLGLTIAPLPQTLIPVDLYLRLDPLVSLIIPLTIREWIPALLPGLGLLLITLAAGRVFCGYICPMGITLDIANFLGRLLLGEPERRRASARAKARALARASSKAQSGRPLKLRHLKYLLLAALLAAALLGVNLSFWAAPIPLITRFYALLIHPVLLLVGNEGLLLAQPLVASLDVPALSYMQVALRRFDSLYFLLFFFGGLFWLERVKPRFWCRYLCPAGGLLALFSLRPLWRRKVSKCHACGRCRRDCPTGAILTGGNATAHPECITCRTCTQVCPSGGTEFAVHLAGERESRTQAAPEVSPAVGEGKGAKRFLPSRRHFLVAAGAGAGMAAVAFSNAHSLLNDEARGALWSEYCIRPPGAVPEHDFLDRCLRCGQCMKVCPTNALQPTWFAAGVEGMFSPVIVSRRGPCEPGCNACGQVCPTRAITPLPLEEKQWAKVGTAVVLQSYCLAWAENRSCVVCEEVCPYGAIKCEQNATGKVPAPVVKAERCFGCGYCEQFCPVRVPAIVVRPLNALRLTGTNYRESAESIGLSLVPASKDPVPSPEYLEELPGDALPPGFSE